MVCASPGAAQSPAAVRPLYFYQAPSPVAADGRPVRRQVRRDREPETAQRFRYRPHERYRYNPALIAVPR
jgi:hypothetical protein